MIYRTVVDHPCFFSPFSSSFAKFGMTHVGEKRARTPRAPAGDFAPAPPVMSGCQGKQHHRHLERMPVTLSAAQGLARLPPRSCAQGDSQDTAHVRSREVFSPNVWSVTPCPAEKSSIEDVCILSRYLLYLE